MRRRLVLLAGLLVASAGSRSAIASGPTAGELQAARELFAKAEKDEEAGRWADALDKLRRASTVKTTPGLSFHIALCEEKQGKLVAALADYTAAEQQAQQEGNKEVLDAVADPLRALTARVPTLTVRVPADVKDVDLRVDGAPLPSGLWGTAVPVEIGAHDVEARARGRTPFSATVQTAERESKVVEVRLPLPSPAPPPIPSSPAPAAAPLASTTEPSPAAGRSRAGAVLATAGAAALAGAGIGAFLVAGGKQSDAQAECATRTTSCDDLRGPVRTFDWLALGAWVAAAGSAALAIVLWAQPAGSSPTPKVGLLVSPGAAGVAGSF